MGTNHEVLDDENVRRLESSSRVISTWYVTLQQQLDVKLTNLAKR